MTNISFETGPEVRVKGTSKKGTIATSYNHLVATFGKPMRSPDNHIHYEWRIQFEVPAEDDPEETDYVTAVIYDWQEDADPASRPGDIIKFNIGGHNLESVYYVHLVSGA